MTDTAMNDSISAQVAALPGLPMKALWALWDAHFPRRPAHTNRHYWNRAWPTGCRSRRTGHCRRACAAIWSSAAPISRRSSRPGAARNAI